MSQKEGVDIRRNRFVIQGEGNIKYTYNNGIMAKDAETAALNFLNALKKLPEYIEKEQKEVASYQKDLTVLNDVVNGRWSKENKLNELKTELASVERKIQLTITQNEENDRKEDVVVDAVVLSETIKPTNTGVRI